MPEANESNDHDNRKIAEEYYKLFIAEQQNAQKYQSELAKWMLASLIFINGGAIVILIQGLPSTQQAAQDATIYFVWGISLAILSGLFAWANCGIRDEYYTDLAKPEMLVGRVWAKSDRKQEIKIAATYYVGLLLGLISLIFFLVGSCISSHSFTQIITASKTEGQSR